MNDHHSQPSIEQWYDIIIIGAGSAGLTIGLFLATVGLKVLMIARKESEIGGECLNNGCVPSKALIHVANIIHSATLASSFGMQVGGKVDMARVLNDVHARQSIIRKHENAESLREQGIEVAFGIAHFVSTNQLEVNGTTFQAKNIIIATGSRPRKLEIEGVDQVNYFDNENIFDNAALPSRLLVIGGGPVSIELAQAMQRLGSCVTVVHSGNDILEHDSPIVTRILLEKLREEGIEFFLNSRPLAFLSATEVVLQLHDNSEAQRSFDAVFVGIGRELTLDALDLHKAGIETKDGKLVLDRYLRTTNKHVCAAGDAAGDLQFSHAAEYHGRILINNFLSPFKRKLKNDYMSWVTFSDPEVATFGLSALQLTDRGISYRTLEQSFAEDDRAVIDHYQYGKLLLYVGKRGLFKTRILGGTMIAPRAGELIQELILANAQHLSINTLFEKIYPYPVASRINQLIVLKDKQRALTTGVKKLLHRAYKVFS